MRQLATSASLQVAFTEVSAGVRHAREGPGAGETRNDVDVRADDSVIKICNHNDSPPIDVDDDSILPHWPMLDQARVGH